jgi:hypothetical protein
LREFKLFALGLSSEPFDCDLELRRLDFFKALATSEATNHASAFKHAAQKMLRKWSPHRVLEMGPDDREDDKDAYNFTERDEVGDDVGDAEDDDDSRRGGGARADEEEEEEEEEGEEERGSKTPKSLLAAARRALTPSTKAQITLLAAAAVPRASTILEELKAKKFVLNGGAGVRSSLAWRELDASGKKPLPLLVRTRGAHVQHVSRKTIAEEDAARASLNAVEELLGP